MNPDPNIVQNLINKPLFDPSIGDPSNFFSKVVSVFQWFKESHTGSTIYIISYILSFFGLTMIIYCLVRLIEIDRDEHMHLKHAIEEFQARRAMMTAGSKNERWDHIQELVNSANASDWRLAVIEADSILEGLFDARDIPGNGIGEKLKNISPGDLGSMQAAWEAHLVRNRIAHEGKDFELNQHDARRTIQLYEVVFRELGFL